MSNLHYGLGDDAMSDSPMASSLALWVSERASLERFNPSNRKADKEIKEAEDWGYARDDAITPFEEYAGDALTPFASPLPSSFLDMADTFTCDDFRMYELKVRRCVRGRS